MPDCYIQGFRNGPMIGHLNSFSERRGGDLNKNFPKIQMPGGWGLSGGMLNLRSDWYISFETASRDTRTLNLSRNVSKFYEWQVVSLMNERQKQTLLLKVDPLSTIRNRSQKQVDCAKVKNSKHHQVKSFYTDWIYFPSVWSGKHQDSRANKTNFFPRGHTFGWSVQCWRKKAG